MTQYDGEFPIIRRKDWIAGLMREVREHNLHLLAKDRCVFCNRFTHVKDRDGDFICKDGEGCSVKYEKEVRTRNTKVAIRITDPSHPDRIKYAEIVQQFCKQHSGKPPTHNENLILCSGKFPLSRALYLRQLWMRDKKSST